MREIKFRHWNEDDKVMNYDLTSWLIHWIQSGDRVMQFTGLKDNNGKEIYEGDIVRNAKGRLYKVEYEEEYAGFYPFTDCDYGSTSYYHPPLEIIGNIYEHPALLK